MLAFHNSPHVKDQYVARVKMHTAGSEIIQGIYWERGRGCAIGCTIHGSAHSRYEAELGIPCQIAYLQDRIFENLPLAEAKKFPLAFLQAIPVGAELLLVVPRLMVWILGDPEYGTSQRCDERGRQATEMIIALYRRLLDGRVVEADEWHQARRLATAAYATAAAIYPRTGGSAADAAGAAYAGAYADMGDVSAAYLADAADAAAAAYAESSNTASSFIVLQQRYYRHMGDKLLELLHTAPAVH